MRISIFLFIAGCTFTAHAAAKTKITCIGNSITYGYGVNENQAYPYRLQQLFGTTQYTVENDGVNATTLMKNGDNPYWKNGKLPQVFAFQPDIITIKLGTNDTKPQNWNVHWHEFKGDYLAMIDTLSSMASKPKIWLVLPVPVFNNPVGASWGIRDSVIKKIIPIIREISTERGLSVIDANTPLQPFPQYFSADGVHPDATGLDTIARVIYRALRGATAIKHSHSILYGMPLSSREIAMGIGIPGPYPVSAAFKLFDLSGRRIHWQRYRQQEKRPVYRWYIISR